jgi:hypothetical protein
MPIDNSKRIISGINTLDSNIIHIGDKTTADKYLVFGRVADSSPGLRFTVANGWEHSPNGTDWYKFPTQSFSTTAPSDGYFLSWNAGASEWTPVPRDHNSLTGHDGGTAGQYFHFTSAQHTWLADAADAGHWTETQGGTHQTSYATGDMLYASAVDTLSKLTIGGEGSILQVNSGVPVWTTAAATDVVSVVSCGTVGPLSADTDGYLLPLFAESTDQKMPVFIAPMGCVLSNLLVSKSAGDLGAQTVDFTVCVNGAATAVTKQLTSTTVYAMDTTNTATLVAGDRVTVRFVSSVTAAPEDIMVNFQVTKTV